MLSAAAHATTITFDDLQGNIPNGYEGFDWNNLTVENGSTRVGTGYQPGTVSPSNIAFNDDGNPASITSAAPFNLYGFYLTAAWYDGLEIVVTGLRNGTLVAGDEAELFPSATAPTLFVLNWNDIDEVEFVSTGGKLHPGYVSGSGEEFALDNLMVDEPGTWLIFCSAVAVLGLMSRRNRSSPWEVA